MLLECPPYCTQQTGVLTRGLTLREIPPRHAKSGEHPWITAFLNALSREDIAAATVRGYRSDLGVFAAWYDSQPIEKLTASDLAHFRQHLSRDRAMKPASVSMRFAGSTYPPSESASSQNSRTSNAMRIARW